MNGLDMHVLECGSPDAEHMIVLLHGFPELAYSWRHQLPELAAADFYVVAPDLRGYGRTTGDGGDPDADPFDSSMPRLVNDVVALVAALGRDTVRAVVGHDFGSPLAGWCALIRPDLFRSLVMMSAPFDGPPSWPIDSNGPSLRSAIVGLLGQGREHYLLYLSTPRARDEMNGPAQGMREFLRGYFYVKSGAWAGNRPYELGSFDADGLAELPPYYVLPAGVGMPEVVAREVARAIEATPWLPDDELAYYADEFGHTGFDGGMRWYRAATNPRVVDSLRLFGGRTIDVPSAFIAGERDWGAYQVPGALQRMQNSVCTNMLLCELIPDAGHWVQQEKPDAVTELLLDFTRRL
ncbi:MAG: alpha/beta hydrolase [Rhodococcus sp. (in: high G+C Gram-positive bacteria)]